jgi:CBS domain-containing protein
MTTVAESMSAPTYFVSRHASLEDVDALLQKHTISGLAVVDGDGELAGVISRSDLIRVSREVDDGRCALVLPDRVAADVMTRDTKSVSPDAPLARAAKMLADLEVHRVFVVSGDDLAGVIATRDVIEAIRDEGLTTPLGDIMTTSVVTVGVDSSISAALDCMTESRLHGLIVEQGGLPIGLLTMDEVLVAQHWPRTTRIEEWMQPRPLCLPVGMPLHRAAALALAMDQRHIVVMDDLGMVGIVTGVDFARAYACAHADEAGSHV